MIKNYFKLSSSKFYSACIGFVMLLLYELIIFWQPYANITIRNAPEAWMRQAFQWMGISSQQFSFLMMMITVGLLVAFYRSNTKIYWKVFLVMIVESILLGVLTGIVLSNAVSYLPLSLPAQPPETKLLQLGLSIGAGLFEELCFRVILTGLLIYIFTKAFKQKFLQYFLAIIIASLLFSWVHYIGSAGDTFTLYSFIFRFSAGLWFTAIFAIRGFGIVAMTHAFYDIFVFFFP